MERDAALELDIDLTELEGPARRREPSSADLADCARAAEAEMVRTGKRPCVPYALLAPLDEVPTFAMAASDIEWFELNPRLAQIVARFDGVSTLREVLVNAAIPLPVGVRDVAELVRRGVVRF
jgi:hypothetical protein